MKTFVISDSHDFENSKLKNVEIIAVGKKDSIEFQNVEFFPENCLSISFNPQNKRVCVEFQLLPNQTLAIGDKD